MRIDEALHRARAELAKVAQRPLLEAEILLAYAIKKSRVYLHAHPEEKIDAKPFFELVKRRLAYEPIEYIIQRVSFYGEEFFIQNGVLIPRPETEILIDEVSKELRGDESLAEIGVGSGVISAILKMKFPSLQITATDISDKAIACARKNFQKFGLDIELVQTDLLDGVEKKIDVIVSNPPYIAKGFELEPNVAKYEPHEALFGGREGDEILKKIIDLFLQSSAKILACEMGFDQKNAIRDYVKSRKDIDVRFFKDLAGLDRGFIIQRRCYVAMD
ncbi:peptide chain release factor N(5)-glutamine methyltransferase [Nitratiruptor sp. SB155-2]|uniref:peptide chain release factor N(5)-glutamine methyltransferase n=1 Tax=Nitratiruptor sp. (strain SB155-2) TaxID=387092 RepID=UPI0001587349|nr:peptide chain release factor N(5)-glutamine methyltransferase [Nitratiruptor sp. SB155-2]BAF70146.1 protoporphyrinogen oxidase [Nitratiruptor sp. SB155-2]